MANYWDGMEGGKHNSDNAIASFTPKKKKEKLLVFFDGNGCVSKMAKKMGYDVRSLDILALPHITYPMDIMDFIPKILNGWIPDKIWFSPPCETFSGVTNMKGGGNRYYETFKIKNRVAGIFPRENFTIDKRLVGFDEKIKTKCTQHQQFIVKTIAIINYFEIINQDIIWYIENPASGLLRHLIKPLLPDVIENRTTYCMYGSKYRKETSIFSNIKLNLKFCPKHRKGVTDLCGGHSDSLFQRYDHKKQPKGVVDKSTYLERSSIPDLLCKDILNQKNTKIYTMPY